MYGCQRVSTKEEKEVLEKIRRILKILNLILTSKEKSFFDKMKDMFS
jgi:hypothetical protein